MQKNIILLILIAANFPLFGNIMQTTVLENKIGQKVILYGDEHSDAERNEEELSPYLLEQNNNILYRLHDLFYKNNINNKTYIMFEGLLEPYHSLVNKYKLNSNILGKITNLHAQLEPKVQNFVNIENRNFLYQPLSFYCLSSQYKPEHRPPFLHDLIKQDLGNAHSFENYTIKDVHSIFIRWVSKSVQNLIEAIQKNKNSLNLDVLTELVRITENVLAETRELAKNASNDLSDYANELTSTTCKLLDIGVILHIMSKKTVNKFILFAGLDHTQYITNVLIKFGFMQKFKSRYYHPQKDGSDKINDFSYINN